MIIQLQHRRILLLLALVLGMNLGSPATASTLFALVNTGELFASTNGGDTWMAQSTLPVSDGAGLIAASAASELYLASQTGTMYRSSDAGVSWNAVGAIAASDVVDLVGRVDGALIALTRSGVIWISTDEGSSFAAHASIAASDLVSITRGNGDDLLALTATGVTVRSTDGGEQWDAVGALPISDAVAIRTSATGYYVLTDTGLTFQSSDQGETWSAVGTLSQAGMRGLAEDNGDLIALHRTGLAARSTNGVDWNWVGTVNQVEVVAVANDVPQTTSVQTHPDPRPELLLAPPRPNPLPTETAVVVEFNLPRNDHAVLRLLDVRGRSVAARPLQQFPVGTSTVNWKLPRLTPGVYFLEVAATGQLSAAARLVLLD